MLRNIHEHLNQNGVFVLFEQTGPIRLDGDTWHRRSPQFYLDSALRAGFVIEKRKLIAFPVFNHYERFLLPVIRRLLIRGSTFHQRCINANRSRVINALTRLFLNMSGSGYQAADRTMDGNTLFVFRRRT